LLNIKNTTCIIKNLQGIGMKIISLDLQHDADVVKEEIANDPNEWFWPYSDEHHIFEQAHMKFINRNLNYFNFASMVAQTTEPDDFNPNLQKTLNFCNKIRTLTGDNGPFGRMCVWDLPSQSQLLPHTDRYWYHFNIIRNIFVISDNPENKLKININNVPVICKKGTLFQFNPATELHEFINHSNGNFYFLGFDFWKVENLSRHLSILNIMEIINNPSRLNGFGANGTPCKYISKH